jgi:flagellar biosynthesis chaperone FliJ
VSTAQLPHPHEARQLCRLRGLRVQRARDQVARAQEQVELAAQAVRQRQQQVERVRGLVAALRQDIVGALAPTLPRWSRITVAQQERLDDQLERNEYELGNEERALEQAQENVQQARAELTRALAREDAVRGLAQQAQRAHLLERDRRAERDLDDQARPGRSTSSAR